MSEQDDTPLDPVLRAALLVEGLDAAPSDEQRSRMANKLAAALGVSAAALLSSGGGGGAAGAAAGATAGKSAALLVGALLVGGGIGATISELRPRHVPVAAIVDAAPAIDAAPRPDAPIDAMEIDAVEIDAAVDAGPHRTKPDAAVRDASVDAAPAMTADELARERQLIEVARAALRGGDLQLAGKSLVEHGMRFPHGALVEEQRVLSIELAIAKGDRSGAATKAAAFRRDYPRSVFRARVDDLSPP